MERVGSWAKESGSISNLKPSPVQVEQAPWGELKEKLRGWGSSMEIPQSGQAKLREKFSGGESWESI